MKSPFPGMDPFLEKHWLDVQPRLIVESCNRIQEQLADDLVARIEERLLVESSLDDHRQIGPDIRVVEFGGTGVIPRPGGGVVLQTTDPVVYHVQSEPLTQRFIQIIDIATGGRVVSVIEFVSPTNKLPGDGRELYQRKQQECRDSRGPNGAGVNLIEIDLTRAGKRSLIAHRYGILPEHATLFQVSVWRADKPLQCELYPIRLESRLPTIRLPLRTTDSDALLDVQATVDAVYAMARYGRTLDYSHECAPPLEGADAAWADNLLKDAGKR